MFKLARMKLGARVAAAIELLEELNDLWQRGRRTPADGMLALYYRHRRYIGSKDRREISRIVYGVMRNETALRWWLEQTGFVLTPRELVLGVVVFLDGQRLEEVEALFSGGKYCPEPLNSKESDWVRAHMEQPLLHADMPESVRLNYPDWMQPALQDLFGDQLAEAMAALNAEASVDLRVNILKATKELVMAALVDD
ncbi:rRNA cytosine-C5-methylase, partial [Candidatus Bathyarchaeota archaeon]|nr:rRNA cytosine-C5-methylase [Candidatus Bathyarchaeota archaeon]